MLAGDARSKDNCRTFVFKGETHTLGNALKNAILRNPQVIFCGYSMPHPAEDQAS
jgi:DNA-directed RNA polymerase I and III subunit RPAC2